MTKRFSRVISAMLVLAMILTMLPTAAMATNVGESAGLITGMPADQSYGVIYSCGEGYSYVMGYDIVNGDAAAKAVELSTDGRTISSLPDGTAIIKFIQNTDGTYYFMFGSKYLVCKDLDANNKEKLILTDTAESGAKWTVKADQAGMENTFNIMNAEYKWNGRSDVYLEQYNGQKFCGYSYSASSPQHFQFKFASTSADPDGRVGEMQAAAALPVTGDTVVIHNAYANAVFGQPTDENAPKPNLTGAAAELKNGTLGYDDIGDGGLIFTVTVSNNEYTFKTGDKYLGMPDNYTDESSGKLINDESLILREEESGYTKWTVSQINGGWLMKNKEAVWKGYPVYIEYFDDLFCGYSYDSSRPQIFAMNFFKITDRYNCGYVVNPAVSIEDPAPAIGADCPVKFKVDDLNALTSITAKYYTTDRSGQNSAPVTAEVEMNNKIGSFTIPAAQLEGASKLTIEVTITDSMDLTYTDKYVGAVTDEPLILASAPAANAATGDETKPEISVTYANVGEGASFEMKLDDVKVAAVANNGKFAYTPAADLDLGKHTVSVTITRADGKSVTKNWTFFVGESGESLYFGQIHAHTAEYSDGAGTLEEAYEHAQGVDDLDFIVITDHSNYFDTTKTATESSYYDLSSLSKNPAGTTTKWEEARATAKEYNEKYDDFLCLYGYEMTWSGGPGHTNTFNTYGVVSRNNSVLNNKTNHAGMFRYNDLMCNADKGLDVNDQEAVITRDGEEAKGVYATKYIPFDEAGNPVPVVSQFNHPGVTFGNFGDFAGYTAKRDDVLNLVEVGNGEGKVGGSSYFPSYEQYDLALSMGWHIGPTNNQDNHKGRWGDSNTCRDVVLTDDFSEIGIYRALDQRRIYSTEDQNLEIYYELVANGETYKIGDIAAIDENDQPENVKVKLTVNDPNRSESIGRIQVIGEGAKVLKEVSVNGNSYKGEIELKNESGFYYIKVIQGDGDIAVTAPVWTSETVPVAVDAKTSAAVAAQGVEETITATLTNGSETEALTLKGYTVTAEGKVIAEEKELSETVPASSAKTVEVPFTPAKHDDKATYEILISFTFVYKDKELTYEKKLTETSYPPEQMTYIGIDRGHKNFYVSGDYANNETSFIQICANNGILCEYIDEGQMTKERLQKYKMLILTVPRINETTQPPVWSEDELAAIADYAGRGGNIINLSKSDRYDYSEMVDGKDTYKYASANLSNMINEAVGAKTRFVRGIVVDPEKKSNESYRISFKGADLVAKDHPFTLGIALGSNGEYQFYNGTGITHTGDGVTSLIKPYDSSWIACYKDNFTGSAYEPNYETDTVMAPKGTFDLVTCETLSGGGFLVCGGACFVSNYDLKTDTDAAQQYENYSMVLNILEYVKNGGDVQPDITPIAEVHAYGDAHGEEGATGAEFTIEGWVTSNASDYDKDTAFFDCIYIQDETRGINAFPVSGRYYIGQKVRAHGAISYYCGEIELNLKPEYNGSIKVISNDLNIIEPAKVTCAEAMDDKNIGNLLEISGVVTDVHRTEGVVDYIYVDDGSGTIGTLFINAYINGSYTGLDQLQPGMLVRGVGIGSRDADENDLTGQTFIRRLRVRSRYEIVMSATDHALRVLDNGFGAEMTEVLDDDNAVQLYVKTEVPAEPTNPDTGSGAAAAAAAALRRVNAVRGDEAPTPFTDVTNPNSYYYDAVTYVYENGLMKGMTDTTFGPNVTLQRAMLVTVLYRIAGEPAVEADLAFTDVPATSYYTNAVKWAVKNDITQGTSKTTFNPKGLVTREQLATFLKRFADFQKRDTAARAELSQFPDEKDASAWAVEALQWAVAEKILQGVGVDGVAYLKPKNTTNRAQVATVLMRYLTEPATPTPTPVPTPTPTEPTQPSEPTEPTEPSEPTEPALDKSALEAAIEEAEKLDLTKYTDETAQALADALEAAKKALDEAKTQDELDAAKQALDDAVAALAELPEEPDGATIRVYETSDIHGFLLDTSSGDESTFQYRLAYIAQQINNDRQSDQYDDLLLLDGGDIYQGNPVSNLLNGCAIRAAMDAMGYDAVGLGNHEFDWGVTDYCADEEGTIPAYELGEYKGDPDTPVLACNLYEAGTTNRVSFTRDYVVVEKAGYRIALIGYIPDYSIDIMAARINPYTIDPDLDHFAARVKEINADEKPDATIIVAHEAPKPVAQAMDPLEVDLVVGGHKHAGIYGTASNGVPYIQGNNQAQGYATANLVIEGRPGAVTAIKVEKAAHTAITEKNNQANLYDNEANAGKLDPTVLAISHAAWDEVKDDMAEKLGYIDTAIMKKGKVHSDDIATSAGNWITGLMLRGTRDQGAVAAFYNTGGIRTSLELPTGASTRNVTAGDIYTINPFCNYWYIYELTGAELAQQLINGWKEPNYGDQVSGLTYTYWKSGSGKSAVYHITSITLDDGTEVDITDNEKTYRVCTSNYSGTLGGGVFEQKEPVFPASEAPIDNITIIELLREEAKEHDGLIAVDTGRRAYLVNP